MQVSPRIILPTLTLLAVIQLSGCEFGYYWQATNGHLELMGQRRPVAEVIDDPDTPIEIRDQLETATLGIAFAHRELLLPDNGSYASYADTGRRYVVWNVFAAAEFSLEPRTWCFPVAGCIAYRGYFDESAAHDFATGLSARGDDIYVGGVMAYSTLGRFADPLLNTMMDLPDYRLAGLIFHELAHQRVYAKDDSGFNESFASFVEQEGVRRWLESRGDEAVLCIYRLSLERVADIQVLLNQARERLGVLYARDIADSEKRAGKTGIFTGLNQAYTDLRQTWSGPPYFDHWFYDQLNNAHLAAMATYATHVPAFAVLLEQHNGDLDAFYASAAVLAALSFDERSQSMQALFNESATTDPVRRGGCPESAELDPRRLRSNSPRSAPGHG
jgi:predicted aminopeptidase